MASYYISPSGNNTTGTGAIGSPWRTIGKFFSAAGAAGDTLYCRGGTYQGSDIGGHVITDAGASGNPITVRNYPGETPVFAGGGGTPTGAFINHQDSVAYITYHGLTVSNWVPTGTGVFTSTGNSNDTPHHIIIENCVISLSSAGISGSDEHCIYVGGGRNITIQGNELIGGGAVGDDGNGTVIFDETYTPHDITITNNLFRNWNSQAVQLWMDGGYNWTVTWNTFINCPTFFIDARHGSTGIVVRNNIGDSSASTPIYNPSSIIDTLSNNHWGLSLTGPDYPATGAGIAGAHDGSNAGWTRPTDSQPITLGLIDRTAATFAPSLAGGFPIIVGQIIDRTAVVFTPTVSGAQLVSLGLVNQTASPFTPSVFTPGLQGITLGLISQLAQARAPRVSQPGAAFIELLYDGVDILDDVVIADATFSTQVNGVPGSCRVRVKDTLNTESFIPGKSLVLKVDGDNVWRGYVAMIHRTYAFPAEDRSTEKARFFVLDGFDVNILFRKRVVFNQDVETDTEGPTYSTDNTPDTTAITALFADFLDLTGDGLDTSSLVENVGYVNIDQPVAPIQPTLTWDNTMKTITSLTNAIFYIDPDLNFVHTDVDTPSAALELSDQPGVGQVGYRQMEVISDATNMVNDALIWGNQTSPIVIARDEDATSIAAHGRWQLGEVNGSMRKQGTVNRRAASIVDGSPLSKRGAKNDRVSVACTVFTDGFRVAQKVDFSSNVFDFNDVIPIRRMDITFISPTALRYRLFLSHEIDMPWGYFDNFLYNYGTPKIPTRRPEKPEFDPPGGCNCGITDAFQRTETDPDWGISDALLPWATTGANTTKSVDGSSGVFSTPGAAGSRAGSASLTTSGSLPVPIEVMFRTNKAQADTTGNLLVAAITLSSTLPTRLAQVAVEHRLSAGPTYSTNLKFDTATQSERVTCPIVLFADTWYHLKFMVESGAVLGAKIWTDGNDEPAAYVESSISAAAHTLYTSITLSHATAGGDSGTLTTEYAYIDATGINRCNAVQFENFDHSEFAGWGVATPSGITWTQAHADNGAAGSVAAGRGQLVIPAHTFGSNTKLVEFMATGGPWTFTPGWTMYARVRPYQSNGINGLQNTEFKIFDGVNTQVFAIDPPNDLIGLFTETSPVYTTAGFTIGDVYHDVFWQYNPTSGISRVKFWPSGTDEPTDWMIETGTDVTIDNDTEFSVLVRKYISSQSSDTATAFVEFIEFYYNGQPCWPAGSLPASGAPTSGWHIEILEPGGGVTLETAVHYQLGSTVVYINGTRQRKGVDYTETGDSIVFTQAVESTDIIMIRYLVAPQ